MHTLRLARRRKYAFCTIYIDRSMERVKNKPNQTEFYLPSTYERKRTQDVNTEK